MDVVGLPNGPDLKQGTDHEVTQSHLGFWVAGEQNYDLEAGKAEETNQGPCAQRPDGERDCTIAR
jgi:hypothetical protein